MRRRNPARKARKAPSKRQRPEREPNEVELYKGNIRPRNVWRKFGKQGRSNKGRRVKLDVIT